MEKKLIRFLFGTTCLLLGIIIGFLYSPVKNGIYCGNNNGNRFGNNWDEEDWDDADEQEDAIPF